MGEITFNDAVAEYIRRKYNFAEGTVIEPHGFGVESGGACETCGYEYVALTFKDDGKWNDLDMDNISAGEFVMAVAAIYTELGGK